MKRIFRDPAETVGELDFYMRIHLGQYLEMPRMAGFPSGDADAERLLEEARDEAFPDLRGLGLGASRGIYGERTSERAKRAYDLLQEIRHAAAWAANPDGGMGLAFDAPLYASDKGLKIETAAARGADGRTFVEADLGGIDEETLAEAERLVGMAEALDFHGVVLATGGGETAASLAGMAADALKRRKGG